MLSLRDLQVVAIQSEALCGILGRFDGKRCVVAGSPRRNDVPPRNDKGGDDWVAEVMEGVA